MKPLLKTVVAICLILTTAAHPENIEEVKELPQTKEPIVEADESAPQARAERCTTCSSSAKLNLKSPNEVLAAIQALPGAEVHTQQSFESCSSDKGCAGLKVKDGRVVERFGNVDAFRAAAASDTGNEFSFHAAGSLGNGVFGAGIPKDGPFWWMNENSPFKNAGAAGNFEKFSKSSSSSFTSGGAGASGAGGGFGGSIDLSANPFLNGDFSKLAGGFTSAGQSGAGIQESGGVKPSSFQSSSFESSSFSSSNKGDIDLSKNPFLNGGLNKFGQGGFQAQGGFTSQGGSSQSGFGATGSSSQGGFGSGSSQGFGSSQFGSGTTQSGFAAGAGFSNKFGGSGYTGSSPSPFSASTTGSNVNLIQNTQKSSEFDYEQQQQTQQNIDNIFQSGGNVGGGDLQQTCAGQGYVCVHKAQCNNGVVNTNGANILQASTKKQYCNTRTEICCRLETASLPGAGGLQGSLGVGSATYSGSSQSGLFATSSQTGSGQGASSSFGAGQGSSGSFGAGQSGSSSFGSSQSGSSGFGSSQSGLNSFGQGQSGSGAFGAGQSGTGAFGSSQSGSFGSVSSSKFGSTSSYGNRGTTVGQGSTTQSGFGAQGTGSFGSNSGSFGSGTGSVNRGVSVDSSFEASRGTTFGGNTGKFGAGGSLSGSGFSTTAAPFAGTTNKFGSTVGNFNNNEVYKSTSSSQSNFIETDSFSAGSESAGVYRPGAVGLKPGIPYLPPVDSTNQPSNVISSTAFPSSPFPTTPRPFSTPKPTYLPPISSTAAPGYLPPEATDQSINRETRLPVPSNPTYNDGQLILDTLRPGQPRPIPTPNEIPAGCAAALKCTPIEFCTAEGVISNTTVILTRDQESYRVPLTDCKDLETGRIGKCCRDPFYTDPWPTNQLGKWVPGVFGGNDGRYTPDSRGSGNNPRPQVTARPPSTGTILLNNFLSTKPTAAPYGPNQVTPGYPSTVSPGSYSQKGQFEVRGQGQYGQGSQGQIGIGGQGQFGIGSQGQATQGGQGQYATGSQFTQSTQSYGQASQGQFGQKGQGQIVTQGQGAIVSQGQGQFGQRGQGQIVSQGQGQIVTQGQGGLVSQGQGQFGQRGQGQIVTQGQGVSISQGQGQFGQRGQGQYEQRGQGQIVSQGQGQIVSQGQGQIVSQGQGALVNQGQGALVSQGQGALVSQGQGALVSQGQGQYVQQGQGQYSQGGRGQYAVGGQGQIEIQGQAGQSQYNQIQGQAQKGFGAQGQIGIRGQGQAVIQGQGQSISQGFGTGFRQGQSYSVTQGAGIGVENEYSESVHRVFLQQYSAGGQCGLLNGQNPFGNRNELEVDFAEIPWQAMVLLQTNRSLLCGGVITRPDVVITSAACVDGLQAKNVLIKGGEWKLGIDDEPLPFQIVQVKNILRHPFYKRGSLLYDVAILVLTENLRFAKNIYPICLPGSSDTLDAFYNGAGECIVTGWGKQVLQAHLAGSIMHSLNVSLINPGECQAKLTQEYPHLLEQYEQESCVCGQPTNPINNICKVDIGSALACTTGDGHFTLRGVYSWDSGCQPGNQLAAFYKFDLEWYQWAIGLIESARFAQFSKGASISQNRFSGQITSGVKGSQIGGGVKGGIGGGIGGFGAGIKGGFGAKGQLGFSQLGQGQGFTSSQFGQFSSKLTEQSSSEGGTSGVNFSTQIKAPISKSFSASYTEKKVFQSEPKIITYTTKPEIVTFTTKPEIFTYTTKPKIVTFTTKPQIITYETSGSGTNPQYVAPGVTFNPSFSEVVGKHTHNAQCKCLENGKKK